MGILQTFDSKMLISIAFHVLLIATDTCWSRPDIYHIRPNGSRVIQPYTCHDPATNEEGVCMFSWNCQRSNGTHLTYCMDRFYFGSCCKLPPGVYIATPPSPAFNDVTSGNKQKPRPGVHRPVSEKPSAASDKLSTADVEERRKSSTSVTRLPTKPPKVTSTYFPPGLVTWRPLEETFSTNMPVRRKPVKVSTVRPAGSTTRPKYRPRPSTAEPVKVTPSSPAVYASSTSSSVTQKKPRPTRPYASGSSTSRRRTRPTRPYNERNTTVTKGTHRRTKPTRPQYRPTTPKLTSVGLQSKPTTPSVITSSEKVEALSTVTASPVFAVSRQTSATSTSSRPITVFTTTPRPTTASTTTTSRPTTTSTTTTQRPTTVSTTTTRRPTTVSTTTTRRPTTASTTTTRRSTTTTTTTTTTARPTTPSTTTVRTTQTSPATLATKPASVQVDDVPAPEITFPPFPGMTRKTTTGKLSSITATTKEKFSTTPITTPSTTTSSTADPITSSSTTEIPTTEQTVPGDDYTKENADIETEKLEDILSTTASSEDISLTQLKQKKPLTQPMTTKPAEDTTEQRFTMTETDYPHDGPTSVSYRPVQILYDANGNEIVPEDSSEDVSTENTVEEGASVPISLSDSGITHDPHYDIKIGSSFLSSTINAISETSESVQPESSDVVTSITVKELDTEVASDPTTRFKTEITEEETNLLLTQTTRDFSTSDFHNFNDMNTNFTPNIRTTVEDITTTYSDERKHTETIVPIKETPASTVASYVQNSTHKGHKKPISEVFKGSIINAIKQKLTSEQPDDSSEEVMYDLYDYSDVDFETHDNIETSTFKTSDLYHEMTTTNISTTISDLSVFETLETVNALPLTDFKNPERPHFDSTIPNEGKLPTKTTIVTIDNHKPPITTTSMPLKDTEEPQSSLFTSDEKTTDVSDVETEGTEDGTFSTQKLFPTYVPTTEQPLPEISSTTDSTTISNDIDSESDLSLTTLFKKTTVNYPFQTIKFSTKYPPPGADTTWRDYETSSAMTSDNLNEETVEISHDDIHNTINPTEPVYQPSHETQAIADPTVSVGFITEDGTSSNPEIQEYTKTTISEPSTNEYLTDFTETGKNQETVRPSTSEALLDQDLMTTLNEQQSTMTSIDDSSSSETITAGSSTVEEVVTAMTTTEQSPTSTTLPTTTELDLDSAEYLEVCGRPKPGPVGRVVGGGNSYFGEWPWVVSLRQWKKNTFLHKCGATLLNEFWAITAAHCVENVPLTDILLRLGEYDISHENEPYPFVERRVQIVASHPQFDRRTFEYDLALLRFYEPVKFQKNVLPVCVPNGNNSYVGKYATVTGWGRLYEDGPLPDVIQEVALPVITNKLCENMYRQAGFVEDIPEIFICAGYPDGGKDSCEGDSGGPMVIQEDDGRWVLAGVISWGIGCALPNQPGVYTRITKFSEWINQIIIF